MLAQPRTLEEFLDSISEHRVPAGFGLDVITLVKRNKLWVSFNYTGHGEPSRDERTLVVTALVVASLYNQECWLRPRWLDAWQLEALTTPKAVVFFPTSQPAHDHRGQLERDIAAVLRTHGADLRLIRR